MLRSRVVLFLLLALATSGLVSAARATDVSGTITTQTWTKANSPYHVTGSITVPAGNTLTIEPGVDVLCDSAVSFVVNGVLNAVGTPQDSIRFLKSGEYYWGGMTFTGRGNLLALVRITGGLKGRADGGGLSAFSGFTDIRNSVISGNRAANGGGVAGWSTTLRMTDCTISGNEAGAKGGGVYGTVKMLRCTISDNSAYQGGGVGVYGGGLAMVGCVVSRNTAREGGGFWSYRLDTGSYSLSGCTVSYNSAVSGAAMLNQLFGVPHSPSLQVAVTLTGCTIVGNGASSDATAFCMGDYSVTDCIVWDHSTLLSSGLTIIWTHCDVEQASGVVPGTGNINADPLFVDAANGDFRLMPGSPCIGTGSSGKNMGAWPALSEVETIISSNTIWTKANSPYRITNKVVVDVGATLTIEPGVDVLFDADVQFVVNGRLHAVGTAQDSIRFLPGSAANWRGIRIAGLDSSSIAYARISGANARGDAPENYGGGLYVAGFGARVGAANSVISGNTASYGGGICCHDGGLAALTGCAISNNSATYGGGVANTASMLPVELRMEGCVVSGNSASEGGGIYSKSTSTTVATLVLLDCRVVNGTSINRGGGIWSQGNLLMERCSISGNVANFGAGLYNDGNGSVTMRNCPVSGNSATSGGGAIWNAQTLLMTDCSVEGNTAGDGGGIGNSGTLEAQNCLIANNNASNNGGAVYNSYVLTMADCAIVGNGAAASGGGVCSERGVSTMTNCVFRNNTANSGGGMASCESPLSMERCVVTQNVAAHEGGGVFLRNWREQVSFTNCTVAYNTASSAGGGLRVLINYATVPLKNCIFWGNAPAPQISVTSLSGWPEIVLPTFSCLQTDTVWAGVGNINADPLFIDPGTDSMRLHSTSPCRDAGDPASPLDPDGSRADMGARPFDPTLTVESPRVPLRFLVMQNAPNPFNPSTTIRFTLPEAGPVTLAVYDINGRLVRTLVGQPLGAGSHAVVWDGYDAMGRAVASGVYVYRLTAPQGVVTRRMVLAR